MKTYKGFNADWTCQGFQYEVGKSYEHDGDVKACASGFHACEYPIDVLTYYEPASSVFAVVEQSGDISRHDEDSKIASSKISIKASIDVPGLVSAAVEFLKDRCTPADAEHATGDSSASSATGGSSASSATGYRSASSATGDSSASSATGHSSASSATGHSSASLTTGCYSTSEISDREESQHAVAIATGYESKARAPMGCAIVLVNRGDDGVIQHIRASKVGENGIKPNVWYSLDENGEFVSDDD